MLPTVSQSQSLENLKTNLKLCRKCSRNNRFRYPPVKWKVSKLKSYLETGSIKMKITNNKIARLYTNSCLNSNTEDILYFSSSRLLNNVKLGESPKIEYLNCLRLRFIHFVSFAVVQVVLLFKSHLVFHFRCTPEI